MEVRHVYSSIVARGLQGISAARTCEEDEGWPAGSAGFGAGGHLRWGDPHRGGEDWRRDAADETDSKEVERKSLVNPARGRAMAAGTLYRQDYLSSVKERVVRVRIAEGRGFLTIKRL